jgi:wobble nucleotide-excising tRNase
MEEVIDASKDVDIADLIETLGIRKWVDDGRKFVYEKNENLCPYCQKETNDEELKNKFKKYFNDNYVKKIDELESLKVEYVELTKSLLDNIFEVSKIYNVKNITSEVYKELTDLFNDNITSFEKKISKSNEIIEFFTIDNYKNELENINDDIEENNQKIIELNTNKTSLNDSIWEYLSSRFTTEYKDFKLYESKALTTTSKINQTIVSINTTQIDIKTSINILKDQTVTTDDAVKNINIILKNTGFDSFEIAEKTTFNNISRYYLKRGDIETDVFKTLSEGEKNFIAFLYFYQLVLGTDDREQTILKKIIVIDDPVSSLDSKVLFILSTLIHKLIEYSQLNKREFKNSNISQVFILTHNIYFYKEVSLNKRPICKDRSHFHVYKNNEFSNIEHKGIDTFISNDYTLLWKTIKELKETEDSTFNITLCNNMRRLIESYINFIGIGHNNWDCLENINVDDPIYIICSSLISEINDSSHRVSVFDELYYHRIMNVNPQQIFNAFELIFRSIGEDHYEMMMN